VLAVDLFLHRRARRSQGVDHSSEFCTLENEILDVEVFSSQKGTKAPQAAGRIHTDFEKGFIMAEVMHFEDFKSEGSEANCKVT
jgi:ribosome-binding ATPase YchF (GTP1/OBG family)